MEKTDLTITSETDGVKEETHFFNYSEKEKQENEINKANAKLVNNWKYLTIPREMLKLGLSGNEVLIFAFIDSWLCENPHRFYFSNEALAEMFNLSEMGISKILKRLSEKDYINLSYKRKADGGQIRFINLPTNTNFKYQLKQSYSSKYNKVIGSNNNINNNKITSSSSNEEEGVAKAPPKPFSFKEKGKGNTEINALLDELKVAFGLAELDGTKQSNRNDAYNLLRRYPLKNLLFAISVARKHDYWRYRITKVKDLTANYNAILNDVRKKVETGIGGERE